MVLPLILSVLGSGLAGAGALGTGILASPLVAGALGTGLGTAIQTGNLGKGIESGLTAGLLGGIGGALAGRMGGAVADNVANAATSEASQQGIRGMLSGMQSGFSAPANPVLTGANIGERLAQIGSGAGQVPLSDAIGAGLKQGVMTGGGLGTALTGMSMTKPAKFPGQEDSIDIPQAAPANRAMYRPGPTYRPGFDPEFLYFAPQVPGASGYAGGGLVSYTPAGMSAPIYMQAGGIADAMPSSEIEQNEKQIISNAIDAIKGRMGEQESAIALARFLQQYGEEELRNLVDDVRSGRADGERGDIEGVIEGVGDGMSDMVPAEMEDGSQDVLLSDGEFVVPADVVSGLGNGSTDAGADELYDMMDRVRMDRTGKREQPKEIAAGGLLPA